MKVSREELKQSLARAASFVSDRSILELEISDKAISLKVNGADSLSDQLEPLYTSEKPDKPVRLGMNFNHISNIVSASKSEYLILNFEAANTLPIIVRDKEEDDDESMTITYVMSGVKLD